MAQDQNASSRSRSTGTQRGILIFVPRYGTIIGLPRWSCSRRRATFFSTPTSQHLSRHRSAIIAAGLTYTLRSASSSPSAVGFIGLIVCGRCITRVPIRSRSSPRWRSARVGRINGLLVTKVGINAVIATLGVGTILSGIGFSYSAFPIAVGIPREFTSISIGRVLFEDLVREVVEGLAGDASRVHVSLPGELPVLTTDRQLLSRVLQNLVDNALKYSPDGSPSELEAHAEGGSLVFWVQDHGIGIPQDEMPRIFDRFYQVDSSSTRTFRGAGLGLSLVADLLEHLGGTIDVTSEPGEGSRFTVRLPVRHPEADAPRPMTGIPGDLIAQS
jgi:hypothetical protein